MKVQIKEQNNKVMVGDLQCGDYFQTSADTVYRVVRMSTHLSPCYGGASGTSLTMSLKSGRLFDYKHSTLVTKITPTEFTFTKD
jgi:hypothetical protein